MFLYIDPLKQGLKLFQRNIKNGTPGGFLYIDPLKQGLKQKLNEAEKAEIDVFIHRSIKTRIETIPQLQVQVA